MSGLVKIFRDLHQGPELLCLANAWDAGSARLAQSLGAAAVATTSGGLAWSLGYADGGAMPAQVAVAAARNIARVVSVPLTIDLEDGYSPEPEVVARYVLELVRSGVAGINLEDGADPPATLAAKVEAIKAAVAAAGGDIFVNVRTDVYLRGLAPDGERVTEVLTRAELYRDVGADGLFVPGICAPEEIRAVAAGAGIPLNVMDWPGLPAPSELTALGVRRLSAGTGVAQVVWGVARDALASFLTAGDAGTDLFPVMDGAVTPVLVSEFHFGTDPSGKDFDRRP
jgi:2-methylisocitrate lyase-like PEP mutase family enzyme